MDASEGHKKNGIRPACERCHQSKTACNRPEDSACARCIRLGLAADCVFHTKKPYKRSKRGNDADVSHASNHSNSAPVAMRDVPATTQPAVPSQPSTNGRPPDLITNQFQAPILPPAQPPQLSPNNNNYVEPYFQSPSRAPSVVIPPSPLNYSPYLRPGQPPMYSFNPTQTLPPITPSMFMSADPRIAMRDRDGDAESIMPLSEQSATPSTLSQLFHMKPNQQPAFEPLPAASNPTQPLLQRIQEDRNSEMQYIQQHSQQPSPVRNGTNNNNNAQQTSSQTSSQISSQRMPSHQNQPPPALQSAGTQTNGSNYSQQVVSSFQQPMQQQTDQQVAVINNPNSFYLSSPYPHTMQNPPLPQPLPRSVFAQFSEMDLCSKLQLLIDRRQLSIRHLHMVAAFLSEGMLEQDYIQLSALTPMPLSCSLKADFAQSESYHVWRSRAVEETLGPNKGNKPQKQFVIFFDFSDSPLLCVEDEEAAAGMHSVSHLNQMARTPQTATYTMRTSRNICASTKTNCTSERSSERSSRKRRRSRRSKRSEASTSSHSRSSSHSSGSDSDDSHESPRSSGRGVPSNETSRQELEELILRRRAAFEGSSLPSSYEEQYPMHLPSCIHYKKEVDATSGALMKSTGAMTGTAFMPPDAVTSTPSEGDQSTNTTQATCTCPVVVHRRMFAQVNREFERLFGWSQREIRDQLIHFGARRWEQRMWKVNVPTAYEVLLMQFIMSAQLDTTMSATLYNKYHSSIQAVIREHVVIADDGDLDGLTFQFHPISK